MRSELLPIGAGKRPCRTRGYGHHPHDREGIGTARTADTRIPPELNTTAAQ